jgi:hypothetical protein
VPQLSETGDNGATDTVDSSADLLVSITVEDTAVGTVKRIRWIGEEGDELVYFDAMGVERIVLGEGEGSDWSALLWGFHSFDSATWRPMPASREAQV